MADLGGIGFCNGEPGSTPGRSITGTVRDATGTPVRRLVLFFDEAGGATGLPYFYERAAYSDPVTGQYQAPFGDANPRTVLVGGEAGYNALTRAGVVPV